MNNQSNLIEKKYLDLGFTKSQIAQALKVTGGHQEKMLDYLTNLNKSNNNEDIQLQQQLLSQYQKDFEILNPEERIRINETPVGLKNIGNTCYFNCLIQFYFHNHHFLKIILDYEKKDLANPNGDQELQKQMVSQQMVLELQALFALMILSNKKYADPTKVINKILDDQGRLNVLGNQQDVGEYNYKFLERISDGMIQRQQAKEQPKIAQSMILEQNPIQSSRILDTRSQDDLQSSSFLKMKSKMQQQVQNQNINSLFFGTMQNQYQYPNGNKEVVSFFENEENFNFIQLDPKAKEFYSAVDQTLFQQINDFRNDRNETVQATKKSFFKSVPKYFFFQVQRTQYSQEEKKVTKNNHAFEFPKEMFIDRFLIQNKSEYFKIREKLKQKREQVEQKKEELLAYLNYQNTNQNLVTVFQTCASYFEAQAKTAKLTSADAACLQTLKDKAQKLHKEIDSIQKSIQSLEADISNAYNSLKKHKYLLQSIFIHDGLDESGHYYIFIHDFEKQIWRKFSDSQVTQVSEQKVFEQSIGNPTHYISAYFLVYVEASSVFPGKLKGKLMTYQTCNESIPQSYYVQCLKLWQLQQVQQDNRGFKEEVANFQVEKVVESILEKYDFKYTFLREITQELSIYISKLQPRPPSLLNFCTYLHFHPNNTMSKYDKLIRWILLESTVKEVSQSSLLESAKGEQSRLQSRLGSRLMKSAHYPESLVLNKAELEVMEVLTMEFIEEQVRGNTMGFMLGQVEQNEFKLALLSADFLADLAQQGKHRSYFREIQREVLQLVVAWVMHQIELKAVEDGESVELVRVLGGVVQKQFQSDTFFKIQLQIWFQDIRTKRGAPLAIIDSLNDIFDRNLRIKELDALVTAFVPVIDNKVNSVSKTQDIYGWSIHNREDQFLTSVLKLHDLRAGKLKKYDAFLRLLHKGKEPLLLDERCKILNQQ